MALLASYSSEMKHSQRFVFGAERGPGTYHDSIQ